VKKTIIAGASALALLAGLFVAVAPANAAVIRVPKTAMQACAVSNGIYCVESLTLTDSNGRKIPLIYVPSGSEVPAKKTPADFYAPVAKIINGKVVDNNWWMSQYQRDVLTSGKMVVMNLSSLLGTAKHPEQGAKYDPTTKTFDINKAEDSYAYPVDCWDPATKKGSQKPFSDCYKGSNVFMLDNEVKFIFFYPSADQAAKENKNFTTGTYVDLAEISATQQRPVLGTTYDAAAKTFGATEGIIIPIWVSQNALVNGWAVAGTVATVPAPDAAAPSALPANTDCPAATAPTGATTGKPNPPTNLKGTVDGTSIKVTWDAPTTGPAPSSYNFMWAMYGDGNGHIIDVKGTCVVLPFTSLAGSLDTVKSASDGMQGYNFQITSMSSDKISSDNSDALTVNQKANEKAELAATAPLAPDASTTVGQPTEAGRALPGRWTSPDWQGLNLGSLGYDGLYVEAKSANEFTNILMIDVVPTLTGADKKVNLAGQVGNKAYATSLDPDIVISAKVRTGEMKPGVTVAVGVDVIVDGKDEGEYTSVSVTGTPVTVPLAKNSADCKGEAGVSKANVRQFQAIVLPSNDDMSGFGVDGTSGDMYVGSNGVCELSTPVWSEANKEFTWTTAAPHFAPDGVTVNRGFYKAIIPTGDAAILWGMTNPNDAATALKVSVSTEAGGSVAAISKISVKNGKIIIDVSGFQFSRPKLRIGIKPGYKPSKATAAKSTITCAMGKSTKKITAVSPVCPSGYKKK
jgi:hypothetical protein